MNDDLTDVALGAAIAYSRGEIDFTTFQRTMALCTIWAQGVDQPSVEQIEYRVSELDTASAFISAAPAPE